MKAQDIFDLRDHIAAFSALAKGDLAAELAAIQAETAKQEEKLGLIKTLDQAQQVKRDADTYATNTKATADSATAAAAKLTADAGALDITSRAKDAAIRAREEQLAKDKAAFQAACVEASDKLAAREVAVAQQEASLASTRQALEDRAHALTLREADVAERMQIIRKAAA